LQRREAGDDKAMASVGRAKARHAPCPRAVVSRTIRSIVLAAALSAVAFDASSAAALHRADCHMNVCNWYSIENQDTVAADAGSTLVKVTLRTWTSKHRNADYDRKAPRVAGETLSTYYVCSKTRPAVLEAADGKWTAAFLDLYNPPGFAQSAVMQYFVVCHGFDTEVSNTAFDVAARKFGYRRRSKAPETITLDKPEEILR
jgi:uncharacterized membrane protein